MLNRVKKKPTCADVIHRLEGTIWRLAGTGTSVWRVMRQQAAVKYRPSFINK